MVSRFRALESDDFRCALLVTGMHLNEKYGHTLDEIVNGGIRVDERTKCSTEYSCEMAIPANMSDAIQECTECFARNRYDAVMVLSDRYEILGVVICAMICRIPLFHSLSELKGIWVINSGICPVES